MKKIITWGIIIILLVSLLPIPQSIDRTFYGVNTTNGESVDISLDMTYLRFLFLKDKMYGTIDVKTKEETFTYGENLNYIGQTPSVNNAGDKAHNLSGWYYNDTMYMREYEKGIVSPSPIGMEAVSVHLSSDFSKILIFHREGQKIYAHNPNEETEKREKRRFVGCTDKNQLENAKKYFIGYYDIED